MPRAEGSLVEVEESRKAEGWWTGVPRGNLRKEGVEDMVPPKPRVAIVEDEPLYRDFLRLALSDGGVAEVVGAYGEGETALAALLDRAPDVVTIDIELSGPMTGIQLGLKLKERLHHLGIVLLTHHLDVNFVWPITRSTFVGWSYLLKQSVSDVGALRRAVLGAAAGEVVLDAEVLRGIQARQESPLNRLTPRQRTILDLMAQGFTNAAIGTRLGISVKSVENQINIIYQELGIDRSDRSIQPRVTAILTYLRQGIPSL